ncbi:MAG: hypothetical protein ABI361_14080 [Nitrososphaera sp.]|jgi:hypothetical protein
METGSDKHSNAPRLNPADPVKVALDYALGEILEPTVKASVLYHFGHRYRISLNDRQPLLRDEVDYALRQFFGDGATLFMSKFDRKYFELTSSPPERSSLRRSALAE